MGTSTKPENGKAEGNKGKGKGKRKREIVKVYKHVSWLDNLLTVAFLAEAAWIVVSLSKYPNGELPLFLGGLVATAVGVYVGKGAARMFGSWLSARMEKQPLKKHVNLIKFQEQMWQFAIHTGFAVADWAVVWNETWWSDTRTIWATIAEQSSSAPLRYLFVAQLSVWCYTLIIHRFWDERRKDYYVMYVHHVATILLIAGSGLSGQMRIIALVLCVHDTSDITVDLLKLLNYLDLSGKKYFYLVEITFVVNLASWVYWRMYHFPMRLVYSCFYELPAAFVPHIKNPVSKYFTSAELHTVPFYTGGTIALSLLVMLHVYWFYLFLRLAWRLINKEDAHKVGREEYEGDSDKEDD